MTTQGVTEDLQQASSALPHARNFLLASRNLMAVGVGLKTIKGEVTGEVCIKTFVGRKLPREQVPASELVPGEFSAVAGTVRTDVDEMILPTSPPWGSLVNRWPSTLVPNYARRRPFRGGDSASHAFGLLGTIATEVVDRNHSDGRYILSCNHVFAALNRAAIGDLIVQPSFGDGSWAQSNVCGFLDRYVPIRFWPAVGNHVDAAVARVSPRDVVPAVGLIGVPAGTRSGNGLSPGERVFKTGRTSLLTAGRIVAVKVSGWIYYPSWFGGMGPAFFENQIITSGMAEFGDSGSLLFDENRYAVGLLFGGSLTHTFFNDISEVEMALGVKVAVS